MGIKKPEKPVSFSGFVFFLEIFGIRNFILRLQAFDEIIEPLEKRLKEFDNIVKDVFVIHVMSSFREVGGEEGFNYSVTSSSAVVVSLGNTFSIHL